MEKTENISVMIVEDEIVLAMALEISLENMGFYVTSIESEEKNIIDSINNNLPDVILMDINLNSEIDGIKIAQKIWKLYKIPIIFLTSYANDKTITKAMECEPYGYLIKPSRDKEIKATILSAINKHRFFFKKTKDDIKIESNTLINLSETLQFDISQSQLYMNNKAITLTKNEIKFFEIMCEKKSDIVPLDIISSYIWREESCNIGKLRTLVYRIKQKIGVVPFENVYNSGYRLIDA